MPINLLVLTITEKVQRTGKSNANLSHVNCGWFMFTDNPRNENVYNNNNSNGKSYEKLSRYLRLVIKLWNLNYHRIFYLHLRTFLLSIQWLYVSSPQPQQRFNENFIIFIFEISSTVAWGESLNIYRIKILYSLTSFLSIMFIDFIMFHCLEEFLFVLWLPLLLLCVCKQLFFRLHRKESTMEEHFILLKRWNKANEIMDEKIIIIFSLREYKEEEIVILIIQ